ncbi:MAG: hypothetical protein WC373_00750 [Smithella sp.]|jgi:hypothetical protein
MSYIDKLYASGMHQTDLVEYLTDIQDAWTDILTKLDADSGVTAIDYVSDQSATIDTTKISARGIRSQGDVIDFLNTFVTKFNAVLEKLDTDGLTDNDYVTVCAIMDVFDSSTQGRIKQNGMNQGDLIWILDECFTHLHLLSRKLDDDATVNTATYQSGVVAIIGDKVDDYGTKNESSTSWSSSSSSSSSA